MKNVRKEYQSKADRFLTIPELERLIQAASNPRDKAILYTAYRHGLRASEVGNLQYGDFVQAENRLNINRLKGSIGGMQEMDSQEIKLLKRYLKTRKDPLTQNSPLFLSRLGNPISRFTLQDIMQQCALKAGIPREKSFFHALKHSIATHLINNGTDVMVVKSWLGHKRIENTLIYAQLSNRKRDEEVGKRAPRLKVG